ncbi:MAG: tetratricopeptide repeat protein [Candidatus Wallbacteria bacterium]|nr:tetratricopeptide repeat protein [Candidatus Wallbacteria bacterium]
MKRPQTRDGLLLAFALALATSPACAGDSVAFQAAADAGLTLQVQATATGSRVVLRPAAGAERLVGELPGARPAALLEADLQGDGKPEHLVVAEEEGSGAYRSRLLVADDGVTILWQSPPQPGADAKLSPDGRAFLLTRVLKGDRPEGDVPLLTRLAWSSGQAVEQMAAPLKPENGWQCLTAGRNRLEQGDSRDAVALLTRAVDSKEGGAEPLGGGARFHLARALLVDGQAGRSRTILLGLKARFPDSLYAGEARRALELFDRTYKSGYEPLVLSVRAEEAARGARWAAAEEAARELLEKHARSGLADRAHYVLGQVHEARSQTRAAVKEFQTLVLYFPDSDLKRLANDAIVRLELPKR